MRFQPGVRGQAHAASPWPMIPTSVTDRIQSGVTDVIECCKCVGWVTEVEIPNIVAIVKLDVGGVCEVHR